jgi:hypothetical protein
LVWALLTALWPSSRGISDSLSAADDIRERFLDAPLDQGHSTPD